MRYIPKWDIVIFRCMFYIIIIIFYVNICCIYWFVYNSYIETILTSYDYDVQAPWLPERDSESEIQVRERLQDLKMTKNKNPIPKAGNTKKLQKSWLSGFWNFSGFFSQVKMKRDTPKPIIPSLPFKFAKPFFFFLSQSNRSNLIILTITYLKQRSNKLLNSLPCCWTFCIWFWDQNL